MTDLVTIGEVLTVLRAPWGTTLRQARTLACHVSGSEVNVAIGLANLDMHVAFCSKVPANFMGRTAIDVLRSFGVDTTGVIETDAGRMGIVFQEFGVGGGPSESTYDRSGSAFTTLREDEIDWARLREAKRFLCGGITAALGRASQDLLTHALGRAKDAGVQVVFDVNYRSKLWTPVEARRVIEPMLSMVDVLFVTRADAERVLDCRDVPEKIAGRLRQRFDVDTVIVSMGADGAFGDDGTPCHVPALGSRVLNRFGMGDAFVVGVLYGLTAAGLPAALKIGHAAAALKGARTDENYCLFNREQLERRLAAGDEGMPAAPDVLR